MDALPTFLIADNSAFPEALFVVHTEYPRFVLNVFNDDVHWLEDFQEEDEKTLMAESVALIEAALNFYDDEIEKID